MKKEHEGATRLEEIVLNADYYDDAFSGCTTELAVQLNEVLYNIIDYIDNIDNYDEAFDVYKEELECRFE